MAKSTYYFEINRNDIVAERNQEVLEEIKNIFEENKRRYGVRRVHQELINRGYQVNHKRVQRLMHEAGLAGKRPKEKYHSYKGQVGKIADNIIGRDLFGMYMSVDGVLDDLTYKFPLSKEERESEGKEPVSVNAYETEWGRNPDLPARV